MKPSSRSRSGPARDRDGRFVKGRSVKVALDPAPDGLNEAVAVQDKPVQVLPQVEVTDLVAASAVNVVQLQAAEDDEVSRCDLEGSCSDSSSPDSDFDNEEVGKSVEQQELCSTRLKRIGNLVAQQVLDEMPHSDPTAIGVNRGGGSKAKVSSARVEEKGVGSEKMAPWVNLFKDNRNLGTGIKLHEVVVDGDLVQLDEEDIDEVVGICLVGLFTGKFPGVRAVQSLQGKWKVECKHWIHRSGWILFEFQSEEDRLKVLNGGPYFAYGSNLMLKILPPCFRFGSEEMTTVPTWIQLPDLPFDCWTERALSKIVSKVGIPITTDKLTRTCDRISFARVLVEVDVSKDLVTSVEVKLPTGVIYDQLVVFESTPKYCKKCKTFGHGDVGCNKGAGGRFVPLFGPKKKIQHGGVVAGNMEGGRPLTDKPMVGEASSMMEGILLGDVQSGRPVPSGSVVAPDVGVAGGRNVANKSGVGLSGGVISRVCPVDGSASSHVGVGPVEDLVSGDVEWTTVGKKGKLNKKSGQHGVADVQLQDGGVTLLGATPSPGRAEGPAGQLGKPVTKSGQHLEDAALPPCGNEVTRLESVAVEEEVSSEEEGSRLGRPGGRVRLGDPDPDRFPYVPRWRGKGKGRHSFGGRGTRR